MALKSLNFTLLVVDVVGDELSVLSDELQKKRMTAPDFFNGAPIVAKIVDHALNIDFFELKKIVDQQGFILLGISGDLSTIQKEQLKAAKIALLRSSKRQALQVETKAENTELEINSEAKTKIYTGRVRSGQQIYAKEGDLVINGDVSAGAEVIADGSIQIYGALRGKALAGAMGDQNALIFCRLLSPELVSIAGVYKLSDDLSEEFAGKSCIVSREDEQIVLADLS